MSEDATFEIKLDAALRDDFVAEAEASHRSAQDVIRAYMASFVAEQRSARGAGDYDAWFRSQVQEALAEADDPGVPRISHEEATAMWRAQRDDLSKRLVRD